MKHDFAVIGGDARLAYAAQALLEWGYSVIAYAAAPPETAAACAESLSLAVSSADVVIGPIPLTRDQVSVFASEARDDLTLAALAGALREGQTLFAGCIPDAFARYVRDNQIEVHDLMEDEELTLFNTIATAEGAIAEAILHQPTQLHGSRCLILGFGNCAKTLAMKLKGLEADTTICARSSRALAEANAHGYGTLPLADIARDIYLYEYIFNTVPSVLLHEGILERVARDALIIDIASAPGGVDLIKAREKCVAARLCPGLPGKYAPKSAGRALADAVLAGII